MDGAALVAWNLRRLRVARGLSQEALAVDAGLDRSFVGRLERGRENPSMATLDRLSAALHVKLVDLVVEPGVTDPPPTTLPKGRKPGRR
jgi:transcriptional regulator with XRE-family HTH domain